MTQRDRSYRGRPTPLSSTPNPRCQRRWIPENSGRFAYVVLLAAGVSASWVRADSLSSAFKQAQDMVRQSRSNQNSNSGWRPPGGNESRAPRVDPVEEAWAQKVAEQNQAEAARVERQQAQFKALYTQGNDAFRQRNYREALQYYEALRIAYRDAGISSPQLKDDTERAGAYLAWNEARTADQFRAAVARRPSAFSAENLRYIEELEEQERYLRELPQREAAAQAALAKVNIVIDRLAASMGSNPPSGRKVLVGTRTTRDPIFGGLKSDPDKQPDNGTSDEHAAVEHGLGFDDYGRLKGAMDAPPPVPQGKEVGIPERVLANPEFQRLPAVVKLKEFEAKAEVERRAAVVARARFEEKKAENPAAGELLMLNARAKDAEDRAAAAQNMATFQKSEVKRTVSFTAFDVDPPPAKPDKPVQP